MTKHVVLRAGNGLLTSAAYFGPIFMDALASLEERLEELETASVTISDTADTEERDFTEEEQATIEANAVQIENLKRQIAARKLIPQPGAGGRKAKPEASTGNNGQRRVPASPRDSARHGFAAFGKFAKAVRDDAVGAENEDVMKLRNAATTYGNEGNGADGGFLVPPEFSSQIMQKVMAEENLMNRCAQLQTGGNSMIIPKDETTPWQTSGGIQVYWGAEAGTITQSKGVFEQDTFRLHKLFGLVPVTDELLDDAIGLQSWLTAKAPAKMAARINTAIVGGTGVGQPLGIIPSYAAVGPSVVQVSKQTSQPADTIWHVNIEKMWSRMYAPWRRNAVWLINQDLEEQIGRLAFQPAGASSDLPATTSSPINIPPAGISQSPYQTLKGRPVIPVEACAAIGDLGDIILVDLNQYWTLTKAGGIQTDTSVHLYFDQDITAFRFIFRINGQPAWSDTIARQNGSNTLSWAVALQAR